MIFTLCAPSLVPYLLICIIPQLFNGNDLASELVLALVHSACIDQCQQHACHASASHCLAASSYGHSHLYVRACCTCTGCCGSARDCYCLLTLLAPGPQATSSVAEVFVSGPPLGLGCDLLPPCHGRLGHGSHGRMLLCPLPPRHAWW